MGSVGRAWRWLAGLVVVGWLGLAAGSVQAQFLPQSQFQLSPAVHLPEIDSATRQHLSRVDALVANQQWDEAIDLLQQVMENQADRVVALDSRLYLNTRDYCHLRLSRLPEAPLAAYRRRVDPLAREWYEQGVQARDAVLLENVVDQLFCSSWGDDALLALGEMALERGDYGAAYDYWYRLIESPPLSVSKADFDKLLAAGDLDDPQRALLTDSYQVDPERDGLYLTRRRRPVDKQWTDAELRVLARLFGEHGLGVPRLVYPGTDIPLADIRARHVLLELLIRSDLAEPACREFARQYQNAEGRFAGRQQNLSAALEGLLEQSQQWSPIHAPADWPTFAGSPTRNRVATSEIDIGRWSWKQALPKVTTYDGNSSNSRRVAEDLTGLLSYHPVVVGPIVFVATQNEILALDLATGKPAWGSAAIYQDADTSLVSNTGRPPLGVPRYTLTVNNGRLFAKMGSPVTSSSGAQQLPSNRGYLVCLDLRRQGSILWDTRQLDRMEERWSYDGTPVSDGPNVYVAMRRSEVHPKAYVACLDAQTGHLRWRREVCSAETLGQGQQDEITHNLLTLHGGMIYFNTNLGAVAALSTGNGRLRWVRRYERAEGTIKKDDLSNSAAHFFRDLTPCVYDHGTVYAAPADSPSILAIDAASGTLRWESPHPKDAIHLLGIGGGHLIASGRSIWFFDLARDGLAVPPSGWPVDPPAGYGRGVLAGGKVYFPMRGRIHVFDQRTGAQVQQPIELTQTHLAESGNLVVAGGHLLVAAADTLYAFPLGAGSAGAAAAQEKEADK